jgi:sulfur-oxidizing protein SoxX
MVQSHGRDKAMTILLRLVATAGVALLAGGALAEQKKSPSKITTQQIEAVLKAAFPRAPADWAGRVAQDETLKACSEHRNKPPSAVVDAILVRERATIKYPSRLASRRGNRAIGLRAQVHR